MAMQKVGEILGIAFISANRKHWLVRWVRDCLSSRSRWGSQI